MFKLTVMDSGHVIIILALVAASQPGSSLPTNCRHIPDDEEAVCTGRCPSKISTEVKFLRCLHNGWTGISQTKLAGFGHLKSLDLSNGRISQIQPGSFQRMKELEDLSLSNNKLTVVLPDVFSELPKLRRLDLSFNHLTVPINAPIIISSHLQALDLSSCGFVCLSKRTLSKLPELKELRIVNNTELEIKSCPFPEHMELFFLDVDEETSSKLETACRHGHTTKENALVVEGFNKSKTVIDSDSERALSMTHGTILALFVASIVFAIMLTSLVFYRRYCK